MAVRLAWPLVAAGLALAGCGAERPLKRSLVLIVIDTLRQDHLAAYGYGRETAPGLSLLAREGAVLDAYSPTSWTRPATASLLTGLHPLRHQAIGDVDALPPSATTLAEVLRARGYVTVGVSTNFHVSEETGFGQGFGTFVLRRGQEGDVGTDGARLNEALTPHLPSLRRPFFLYLHYVDPHGPYQPPRTWDDQPLPGRLAMAGGLRPERLDASRRLARDERLRQDLSDLYDGEIREADRRIADVLGALDARGLLAETVVAVTSDHGEEFGEHGRLSHGYTLYEEVVRVPLIIHAPGLVPPARLGPASLVDVMPSLLSLLGIRGPGGDGQDLGASLRSGRRSAERSPPLLFHLDNRGVATLALWGGPEKLLLSRRPYARELFDLESDPGERRDLIQERPAAALELTRQLVSEHNRLAAAALPRARARITAALLEALAALGYHGPPRSHPRTIPPRISPPPEAQPELLWDDTGRFQGCLETAADTGEAQLLWGWYEREREGRWTEPRAALALRWPAGAAAATLELRGVNHEPRRLRFEVGFPGGGSTEEVPPGPFVVRWALAASGLDTVIVRLDRNPPFRPAASGLADPRTLGVFVTSACLVPAPADQRVGGRGSSPSPATARAR